MYICTYIYICIHVIITIPYIVDNVCWVIIPMNKLYIIDIIFTSSNKIIQNHYVRTAKQLFDKPRETESLEMHLVTPPAQIKDSVEKC